MPVRPFAIRVPDEDILDLTRRLTATRWPDRAIPGGWDFGTDQPYLEELCAYWRDQFDWRAHEAALNTMPQFTAGVDGYEVHFVHVEGDGPAPLPLVFSHGWPGSFYEVHKVLGALTDPGAHGGDPADAFHVVAPSLPGYGFSQVPTTPGFGQARTAELWDGLMLELGYERYVAQGGDWGAFVTAHLALGFPSHVVGAHMNLPFIGPPLSDRDPRTEEERRALEEWEERQVEASGYSRIQGTRPQSLAYGLTDSPAGLAGWITEKWRSWSDCDGEVERRFSKDELLTNISIYWFTNTIASSVRYYYELYHDPERNQIARFIETPCGFAIFPAEPAHYPRSWVARGCNVQRWSVFDRGGHFAAMEEPELLVEDIREFFRPLR